MELFPMELFQMERARGDDIGYEKYEERRILDYKSEKDEIERLKRKIKWNEKMIEFQKAFLKRRKELFANEVIDEVIDEYY